MNVATIKDYQHPKRTVEQINIWFSRKTKVWVTCALLPLNVDNPYINGETTYRKERVEHPSFREAVTFLENNYVGRKS